MNAFEKASLVEHRGIDQIERFLRSLDSITDLVPARNGRLAESMQKGFGDAYVRTSKGRSAWIDYKVETRTTGNIFLETFSNRVLDRSESERDKLGWIFTSEADWLVYFFLDTRKLYIIPMNELCDWAWKLHGRMYRYPQKEQRKYSQRNVTMGRIVPLSVIKDEVGFKEYTLPDEGSPVDPSLN